MSKAKRKFNVFQDELLEGEEILWMDKPQAWKLLNVYDLYLIPFSLFWCGIVFSFWQGSGFILFILPHTLIGLYMLFGRFIVKYLRNRRTYYAVTDRRILIMSGLLGRKFQTFPIRQFWSWASHSSRTQMTCVNPPLLRSCDRWWKRKLALSRTIPWRSIILRLLSAARKNYRPL